MTRDLHSQMLNRTITDKLPLPQEDNMRGQNLYNKETDQNKIKTCLSIGASRLRVQKKTSTPQNKTQRHRCRKLSTKWEFKLSLIKTNVQNKIKTCLPITGSKMKMKKKTKNKNKTHRHLKTKQNKKSSLQTINEITSLNLLTLPLVTLS